MQTNEETKKPAMTFTKTKKKALKRRKSYIAASQEELKTYIDDLSAYELYLDQNSKDPEIEELKKWRNHLEKLTFVSILVSIR